MGFHPLVCWTMSEDRTIFGVIKGAGGVILLQGGEGEELARY